MNKLTSECLVIPQYSTRTLAEEILKQYREENSTKSTTSVEQIKETAHNEKERNEKEGISNLKLI